MARRNYISKNGFSPQTNREVGSFTYALTFFLVACASYWIWGDKMLTEIWFYAAQPTGTSVNRPACPSKRKIGSG
jgi:hypothetical protein